MNAGTITGYTGNAYVHSAAGFYGTGGGLVTNQSGGVITGFFGVSERAAALTVQNAGSIGGNATVSAASGVYLGAGGSVTNQAGGTISGYDGVLAVNTAATVVNAGVIAGNYTSNYQHADGVYLGAGGSVTNLATGNIYGRNDGVQITGGRGTVLNLGSIHSRVNATYGGPGISLDQGGIVTNGTAGGSASTAFIAGYNYAIKFGAIGTDTVVNYGTISGNPGTVAVTMATGTVINGPSGATGAQIISGLQSNAVLIGGPGTVVNYGTIGGAAANGEGHISYGVSIGGDGTVVSRITNTGALARIYGYVAVYATQNATVTNAGTMEATQQFGGAPPIYAVIFGGGTNRLIVDPGAVFIGNVVGSGPVTLAPGGNTIITGTANGVGTTALELASGTSSGTLSGLGSKYTGFSAITIDTSAKWTFKGNNTLAAGLTLTNSGTLTDIGTLINAGTITSGTGAAINLVGVNARLIDKPGAKFFGSVGGGGDILELASASGAGTISGFGTSITNFGSLVLDTGAHWTVAGNASASGLGTLGIAGFTFGDTIDLTGFVATSETFASNTLVLTNASNAHATLHVQGAFQSGNFSLTSDGAGGTNIVICFAAGTLIDTPAGEVQVEKLTVGDLVATAHNGPRPVKWIGKGKVLSTRGKRTAATPVIVCKGALGANLPHQDLRVTKAHSLYLDGVLIPVEFLVNHKTIIWDDRAQEVEIYHVELESHDLLIANGVPAESYRDDGNRWLFQNANSGWGLPPQEPYAPVLTGGPVVDAVWRRLLDAAGPRYLPPMTDDPDVHLVVDGQRIDAVESHGLVRVFHLPGRPDSIHLASRDVVPAELGFARDPRSLGVALRRMMVRRGTTFETVAAQDACLTDGFHDYEDADNLRWTNGFAVLPLDAFAPFSGAVEVVLTLAATTHYPEDGGRAVEQAA